MSNKRNKNRKAKSKRTRSKLQKRGPASTPNVAPVRVISSTIALQNLLQMVSSHGKHCKVPNYEVDGTKSLLLHISCLSCGIKMQSRKDSESSHNLSIADCLASGSLCAGVGYTVLNTLFSALEIPIVSKNTYLESEEKVGKKIEEEMRNSFQENGKEEKRLAIEQGDIIWVDGVAYPFINVTVDAGWAKRSYGHSYSSNAGVAVIIGSRTKKILWMDYRIKTCVICDRISTTPAVIPKHICYKNWKDSAQSMEADIIVDGFRRSLDDHGLIYRYMVGDADSSVFAKIQSQVVYPGRIPVQKIDCVNHAVRGLNSKLYSIMNCTSHLKTHRDNIKTHIHRLGLDVKAAVSYNHRNQTRDANPTTPTTLAEDIVNIPSHVFGNHEKCKSYFCKTIGVRSEEYSQFINSSAGKEMTQSYHRLANRSQRLIFNVTSNFAECFMSVMNKYIGGKRINYAQRGSYARRAFSASLAFDHGPFWLPNVFKKKPSILWTEMSKIALKTRTNKKRPKPRTEKNNKSSKNKFDYGPEAAQGKLSDAELFPAINVLVRSLQVTQEQQQALERKTIGQSFNEEWKFERRNRITASNCKRIFSLRDITSNLSILKSLLYPTDLSTNENIKNGINLEPEAKRMYSFLNGIEVEECGLFVSLQNGVLAASPDGILEKDGILEIKCITCPPEQVPNRSDKFLVYKDKNDKSQGMKLNHSHKYYYQILMQLHVTSKSYCDLFVYHKPKDDKENVSWFQERITRNDDTQNEWEKVQEKLLKFYMNEVAPEICDPIFHSSGTFRVPEYRTIAMESKIKPSTSKSIGTKKKLDES